MGKILSFPKEKTKRISALQKIEAKRFFYALSAFSVIAMAVVIAEKLNSLNRPQYILAANYDQNKMNRAIASQENIEVVENIRWGHDLVGKINDSSRIPAAIGSQPDQLDQLRYGELAGKYRLVGTRDQKIMEIEYVESDHSSEVPVHVRNRSGFLIEHKSLLAVSFDQVEVESKTAQSEVYRLLNQEGQSVGKASYHFDEGGRMLSIKVGKD